MCVIVYKPKDVLISKYDLSNMRKSNPHGVGLMYFDKPSNMVVVRKWLSIKDSDLADLVEKLQGKDLVIHFRYATHGRITSEQAHPFFISENYQVVTKTASRILPALCHNGVIPGYGSGAISDTISFTMRTLARLKESERLKLLAVVPGKWCHLSVKGSLEFFGEFEEYKDLFCSNLYWMPTTYKPLTASSVKGREKSCLLYDDLDDYENWYYDKKLND